VKVYLETMGCQMNSLDSELVEAMLRRAGMERVDEPRAADVLLYNTCSVRQHAEDKVHSRLGWACRRKSGGRPLVIGVLGCMAQRLGEELLRRHPGVDIVCGPGQLAELIKLIEAAPSGPRALLDPPRRQVPDGRGLDRLDRRRDATRTHRPGQAYVRILRGCNKFCAYCVVPFVRGPEVSRSPRSILDEVRRLADAGVTQVTLLGQTVNSYCHSEGGRTTRLAELLTRIDAVDGIRRVHFITNYPAEMDRTILEAMRDLETVCEYLHVPAQSGSDRVLKAMGRHYTRSQYDELIDQARQLVPGLAVSGDFIVGFPGETDADHAASVDLIRRSRYKNSFLFKYSPRPATAAARRLTDDVGNEEKRRRHQGLLAVQGEVSLVDHRARIGGTVEVLVEGPSVRSNRQPVPAPPGQRQLTGRTRTDHIVVFNAPDELVGRYVRVSVEAATPLTLIGRTEDRE